jgi:hypothetical protein
VRLLRSAGELCSSNEDCPWVLHLDGVSYSALPDSWGSSLIVVAMAAALLYLLGGAMWMNRSQGVALSHEQLLAGGLLPNRWFWVEIHSLVIDGVNFVRGGGAHRPVSVVSSPQWSSAVVPPLMDDQSSQRRRRSGHSGQGSSGSAKSKRSSRKSKKSGSPSKGSSSSSSRKSGKGGGRGGRKEQEQEGFSPSQSPIPSLREVDLGRQETEMTDAFGLVLRR